MLDKERFGNVLKSLRVKKGRVWTQEETARRLGISRRTYVGWENGESFPTKTALKKLVVLFQLDETEAEVLFRSTHQAAPVRHNLPFARNPFFTGRKLLLNDLERLFAQNGRIALTQPVSVSGLGGIGKTQLALEYAHRCYPHVYRSVLWVNASDKASLEASYLSLAHLLQLPERQEPEVDRIVQAVKSWLEEHTYWLLILDNADDLSLTRAYLPTKPRGHILLTTRSQIVGNLATKLQVEAMSEQEGLLFLLRRCGSLPPGTEPESLSADLCHKAGALVAMLSGHPLALDQAGAYIEETTDPGVEGIGAALTGYRQLYQEQRHHLLQRRGSLFDEHPETVATTIEICLQKACKLHPRCAEVLAFCAFLHPDAIPEELLCKTSVLNLDSLQFDEAIQALRRYSLLKRDIEKQVLSLHRLVQAVIKDGMDTRTLGLWIERVVRALNEAFPEVTFEAWSQCERYLPHVLVCAGWIEKHEAISPRHSAQLLYKAGIYLRGRGQYERAELLLVRALSVWEQILGAKHPNTAESLRNLAIVYSGQGKYSLAEPLYQRALAICEQHLEVEHSLTSSSLNNLANLYSYQGKYSLAKPLYQRALAIREQHLGAEHPDTATSLNNLANLYWLQGKYERAEPLYQRALAIREQHLGAEHPDTATSLHNLAELFRVQGKHEQAEALYQHALVIREKCLGEMHPETADSLNDLAILYREQGKYTLAEPLYQRALAIREQRLGAEHPDTAKSLNNLAELYQLQGKYELAEPLCQRAVAICEQHLGVEHPLTVDALQGWAKLAQHQGKYKQAEALSQRALSICEQLLGSEHPETARSLNDLANLYREQGKDEQAELLSQRAIALQEQPIPAQDPQLEQEVGGVEAPIAESSAKVGEPDRFSQERQKRQSHIVPVIGNIKSAQIVSNGGMAKRVQVQTELTAEELHERYRQTTDAVERTHWHILWQIKEGKSPKDVAELTGYTARWVRTIVRRWNTEGEASIRDTHVGLHHPQ